MLSYKSIDYVDMCDLVTNYFWYHEGLPDLWEIVRVITKIKGQSELSYRNIYIMDLYSVYKVCISLFSLKFNRMNLTIFLIIN